MTVVIVAPRLKYRGLDSERDAARQRYRCRRGLFRDKDGNNVVN